ncbi:hypothetical protein ANCCAN_20472 [Ancylostoma caninum]|uniref:Aminopeptidase N-like N-terminal domain-containing protein n=1 Tax=Ancylostoma caninum TaxID=29170 RepID=A0A368FNP8_ANCCA|nr:hypothetical protein ANCCAN_20472 [Ancylostoma caninum]
MTFDGSVVMPVHFKKRTSVITLNALNLKILELKLTNLLQLPVKVVETKYNNETQQLAIHLAQEPPVGTVMTLSIKYTGLINRYQDGGLFYTYYMDLNREVHWMVATQMESFAARAVFPCMDEPAYKAVRYPWIKLS